jgi:hypothetical protein
MALFAALLFMSCELDSDSDDGGGPASLAGTYWWWSSTSLQLFFVSEDRVLLYSISSYYPYEGYPFRYTYPAPGYTYSYAYNPEKKTGSIGDLHEYSGGPLGRFAISGDSQTLTFPNYKSYGHGADFTTLRPTASAGYGAINPLPPSPQTADMDGTMWLGAVPGSAPGGQGNLVILYFYAETNSVYVTRTWDIDKDSAEDTRRKFDFSVNSGVGSIPGVGAFVFNDAKDRMTFAAFPKTEDGAVLSRVR